jgi:chaperonin GroEL
VAVIQAGAGLFEGSFDFYGGLDGDEATGADIVKVALEAPLGPLRSSRPGVPYSRT